MVTLCLELQPFVFLSRWDNVQIDAFLYNIQYKNTSEQTERLLIQKLSQKTCQKYTT